VSTIQRSCFGPGGEPVPRCDPERIRQDFPLLANPPDGRPLVYLDSAATTQKPQAVIDAVNRFYTTSNSNVHRGVHRLSQKATEAYESARSAVGRLIGSPSQEGLVFVRGATEGINLVAQSWGRPNLNSGDEILVTEMEHHSNIVPWQILCEQTGAILKVAPIDDRGDILREEFTGLLSDRTRIVSIAHVSNALGTVNPVRELVALAHDAGAVVMIDGAQAAGHMPVSIGDLDCDFYVLSGHKMMGPTGIGVLYGRPELLEAMPPYQGGGDMIRSVTFEKTIYNDIPYRFEAGTPNIAGAVGLGAAVGYLEEIGWECVESRERDLVEYATHRMAEVEGLRIIGTARVKSSVVSFILEDVHPHDIGTILDHDGIAIRTGHHCAQPVMERFGVPATARASFSVYNTRADVDALLGGLERVIEMYRRGG
jgi:cysteine desulfurase/selenocysteine lyase